MSCESWNNELELRKTPAKGDGVFAARRFHFGEIVLAGVMHEEQPGNHVHASQIGENKWVLYAGLRNQVNHSCEPNCGIRANQSGGHNLIAIKEIEANDEITYDYAMENYVIDHFSQPCRCGAGKCRIRITGWKDLTDKQKQEIANFAAPYLLEL
jgi:hypothetical protein